MIRLLIALLIGAGAAHAVDTTIVSTGTDTPYQLTAAFIDSSSVRVVRDSTATTPLPFHFDPATGMLTVLDPPPSGQPFLVRYHTRPLGLPATLRLYPPSQYDSTEADSTRVVLQPLPRRRAQQSPIEVSGYKSIGVSLGSNASSTLRQGLDIDISGRIGRRTKLSAHLTDQATTLEGGTRELSELDRVYLTLTHPRYAITVGDQLLGWLNDGLIEENKQIKGIAAALTTPPLDLRAFGAISSGAFAIDVIAGHDGLQGPYFLDGNGEADMIMPLSGTVTVQLDGEKLREGADAHYTIDYDYGSITFAPEVLITDQSLIRVAYEYKTFNYQRVVVGTDMATRVGDSTLTVEGALWYESDNQNEPIDLTINEADIALLHETGDSTIERLVRVPIDSRDVEEWAARYPLYALHDSAGSSFFVYTPFDPATPSATEDLYWVRFRTVAEGTGEYVTDTTDYRGSIYRYVGPGNGNATAGNPLPLPQRTVTGEVRARLRPSSWLDLQVDVAGTSHDRNLYSPRDDDDNNGAASKTSLLLGRRDRTRSSLWLRADHRLLTSHFTRPVISTHESRELWHSSTLDSAGHQRQIWEVGAGATLGRRLLVETSYGQIRLGDSPTTERLSVLGTTTLASAFSTTYTGRFFRHAADTLNRSRRESLELAMDVTRTRLGLTLAEEWHHNTERGEGNLGARLRWLWRKPRIEEALEYTMHGHGGKALTSFIDTAHSLIWRQSIDASPTPFWHLKGSSVWHYRGYAQNRGDQSTVLVNAVQDLTLPRRGLSTHLNYRLSSERASALIQLPRYAGEGGGTHSYDSTRNELVPDVNGDYLLREQQVLDNSIEQPVRKSTLTASWTLKPIRSLKGILGDLRWRGELRLLEHVLPESTTTSLSWLPGYLTLAARDSSAVRLANCFYEQRIHWDPDSLAGYRGTLKLRPYVRHTYSGHETGIVNSLELNRKRTQWEVGTSLEYRRYSHAGTSSFDVLDIGATLTQQYHFAKGFTLLASETSGWARKERAQGWYFVIRPGIRRQFGDKGWAEASYAYAYVDIPGTLDYAMARGFDGGHNHRIDIGADVRMGKHFVLSGGYRSEFVRPLAAAAFEPSHHMVSLEVKALL